MADSIGSGIQQVLEGIPDKTYYRIGEVARFTDVKPYVLRFWETEFKNMAPPKSRSKQRMYRRKDIETILRIKELLYQRRYTIEGARRYLAESSRRDPDSGVSVERDELAALRDDLDGLRKLLSAP